VKRTGQALARHCFHAVHILAEIAIGLVALAVVAAAILGWRLSQGPLRIDSFLRPAITSLNREGPTKIRVGHLVLAWGGWRQSNQPVRLRAEQVEIYQQQSGAETDLASFPNASVSLSLSRLLLGEVRPTRIIIDDASLGITRARDGTVTVNLGSLVEQTESTPPSFSLAALGLLGGGKGVLGELREVRVQNATIAITDLNLGKNWRIDGADLDLMRADAIWRATAILPLELGAAKLLLLGNATINSSGAAAVKLSTTLAKPAELSTAMPGLKFLAMFNAPVSATLTGDLSPDLSPSGWHFDASLGAGMLAVADGLVPVSRGSLSLTGAQTGLAIKSLALDLSARHGAAVSHVTGAGKITSDQNGITGSLVLAMDQVAFADLPELWPFGAAGGARGWVTNNITGGTARDLHVELGIGAKSDFSGFAITRATGGFIGDDVALTWLKTVPGITHGQAVFDLVDRDDITIAIKSGQQGKITLTGGSFDMAEITTRRPQGTLAIDGYGKLPDLLTLLAVPRLHLLSDHPLHVSSTAGMFTAHLGLTLPLYSRVMMKEIIIAGTLHGTGVHLGQVADGHDLDQATVDLKVDNDGLTASGTGNYAQIPSVVSYRTDFRPGTPDEILQHVNAKGVATTAQMIAAGYDPLGLLGPGKVGLGITYDQTRGARGTLAIDADLSQVSLPPQFGWHKDVGVAGHATGVLTFQSGALVDVPSFTVTAPELNLAGRMTIAGGHVTAVSASQSTLGRSDFSGSITLPVNQGDPYRIRISGTTIDLSDQFKHKEQTSAEDSGPHYVLDASYARALMANNQVLDDLTVHAESDHGVTEEAEVSAGPDGQSTLEISPAIDGRRLQIHSRDAGALMLATDMLIDLRGGALTLDGFYDDTKPFHPLTGSAVINRCSMSDAPAVTKFLQALTGYGLIAMAEEHGLAITTLQTSFSFRRDLLTLTNAEAHSASIGFTASGSVNLATSQLDLHGTIVPAYILNSALGKLPLVGGLFSAEKGSGLLAATFSVTGPHDDPRVSVNPLSVLAPGFLRGIFHGG